MGLLDIFNRKPSPGKFAQVLLKTAREIGVSEPMQFDPDEFRILVGADGRQILNLQNLYRQYLATQVQSRNALLLRYTNLFAPAAPPSSFEEVMDRLVPIIRARAYCEYLELRQLGSNAGRPLQVVARPFSRDAVVMVAIDSEHSMSTVTTDNLDQWGKSLDEVLAIAMDKLRDITVDEFEEISPGVFVSDWNDSYDSSRILLPDMAYRMCPSPVAMIPTRGHLLLTSRNNRNGMLAMLDLAMQCAEQDGHHVSATLYGFGPHGAEELPPDDPEVSARLQNLNRHYLLKDYSQQQKMLEQVFDENGTDIFVASYMLVDGAGTGEQFSLCTWNNETDSLLPRTDRVVLGPIDENGRIDVRWDDLTRIAGNLMVPQPDGYPERYRVQEVPSHEQMIALREVAIGWSG